MKNYCGNNNYFLRIYIIWILRCDYFIIYYRGKTLSTHEYPSVLLYKHMCYGVYWHYRYATIGKSVDWFTYTQTHNLWRDRSNQEIFLLYFIFPFKSIFFFFFFFFFTTLNFITFLLIVYSTMKLYLITTRFVNV